MALKIIEVVRNLIDAARAHDAKLNDPLGDGSGSESQAPEGCDYEILLAEIEKVALELAEMPSVTPEQLTAARAAYALRSDDNLEIDEEALVSEGEGGVWVQAWVWMSDEEMPQ